MKNLRELNAAGLLTLVLAVSAFAGETPTPPSAVGQTETPFCATQIVSGKMNMPATTPLASSDTISNKTSLARIAADLLLNFLPLF